MSLQDVRFRVAEHKVSVKIAVAMMNEVPYVLGRYDFFKLFDVTFKECLAKVIMQKA